ncbi:kielin/chordin-like protein isoform X2 [Centruroides sculpturatus]|uniref:kielin/chordin-like protein isoform X2 n=1 Tax=Centruroides sculpturatus TaxID=218467 RepID=UPI000C6E506F|nr:kielin/chordin-like protein isoform X2 [Centruroides sculpturatus]
MSRAEIYFLFVWMMVGVDCFPQQINVPKFQNITECFYNGSRYNFGEEVPVGNNCLKCVCDERFNRLGKASCAIIDCPWGYLFSLYPGCVPLYSDKECCPIKWDCGAGLLKKDDSCQCDLNRLTKHYESKGCTPVYGKKGCHCPTRYTCPELPEISSVCRYHGKTYEIGESIESDNLCERCRCSSLTSEEATIQCISIECPSDLGVPVKEGCYYGYNFSRCCPQEICPTEEESDNCKYIDFYLFKDF